MKEFENIIKEINSFVNKKTSIKKNLKSDKQIKWPAAKKRDIILQSDTKIELGSPDVESACFMIWTQNPKLVKDGLITLAGPDVPEINVQKSNRIPFAKILILNVNGFNEENVFQRYREMELLRYDITLQGYMMRAVSQYMREWSRISKDAVNKGFSLFLLGSELIQKYKEIPYINGAEVIMFTSNTQDIKVIKEMGNRAMRYIGAMTKMVQELSMECDECEYQDICNEADYLQAIRRSAQLKKA